MAWLLRVYSPAGRLLYIASTEAAGYGARLQGLQQAEWWGLANPDLTIVDRVRDHDADRLLALAVRSERPMYYRTLSGEQPYLSHRPAGSDYIRRQQAGSPLNRINQRRGRA